MLLELMGGETFSLFYCLFLGGAVITHVLPWETFYIAPANIFICTQDFKANTMLSTKQID